MTRLALIASVLALLWLWSRPAPARIQAQEGRQEATAAAIAQPSALDAVPASNLSPADLTYRPLPTPTTMLSDAQFDASQASEEQNQLNTMASGQTPAQQMVAVHDAEYSASNP